MAVLLIVDDESLVRHFVRTVLQRAGHVVHEAGDGIAAYTRIRALAGNLDLLVTDVVMPRLDGIGLAQRVNREYPAIDVLYVSGYTDVLPTSGPLLVKPFTPSALVNLVEQVLAASGQHRMVTAAGQRLQMEPDLQAQRQPAEAELNNLECNC